MSDSILPRRCVGSPTYKERSLDFCDFSYSYLIEKTDGGRGFLKRKEAYMLLCRRFSMKKEVVRDLLREMEEKGLISITNRGVHLI